VTEPDGREQVARGALLVALGILVGAIAGVVWWKLAPVAQIRIQSDGGFFVDPDPEQYVASDAWFAGLAVACGLLFGIPGWRSTRGTPFVGVVGLTLGGTLGSLALWRVGVFLGRVDTEAAAKLPAGTIVSVPLQLVAKGLLVVYPVVAVATWLACDLGADLRRRRAQATQPGTPPTDWPDTLPAGPVSPDDRPQPPPPTSA
jgi:hypothetical protein